MPGEYHPFVRELQRQKEQGFFEPKEGYFRHCMRMALSVQDSLEQIYRTVYPHFILEVNHYNFPLGGGTSGFDPLKDAFSFILPRIANRDSVQYSLRNDLHNTYLSDDLSEALHKFRELNDHLSSDDTFQASFRMVEFEGTLVAKIRDDEHKTDGVLTLKTQFEIERLNFEVISDIFNYMIYRGISDFKGYFGEPPERTQ